MNAVACAQSRYTTCLMSFRPVLAQPYHWWRQGAPGRCPAAGRRCCHDGVSGGCDAWWKAVVAAVVVGLPPGGRQVRCQNGCAQVCCVEFKPGSPHIVMVPVGYVHM
jgi:hypothetical protein